MNIELFLDSGAFSAWNQGISIDIQKYISFIKEHQQFLTVYANLDVIGDAKGTFRNQKIMEQAGLNPLPCFHYGEPTKYLKYYMEKYDYIALGGMVPISSAQLVFWLDEIFTEHICKGDGMPKCKVHGFGMTSLKLMLRYPWYSIDSTSWVVTGRLGSIYVPRWKNGWSYHENSWKISVSNRVGSNIENGRHFDTMSKIEKQIVLRYLDEKGFKFGSSKFRKASQERALEENEKWAEKKPKDKTAKRLMEKIIERGVSNIYQLRDEINVMYFQDLEKRLPEWPWKFKPNLNTGFGL